jgi:bifunctional NMN adenylyltransferase/nudix hydrolase
MTESGHDYFDCLIYIGRFQPLHAGHLALIRAGLERAALLLVVCGSARRPRSAGNPWNETEREAMLRGSLTGPENNRVHVLPVMDDIYNDAAWARDVETTADARAAALAVKKAAAPRTGLIVPGHGRRDYYAGLFRRWERLELPVDDNIRTAWIRGQLLGAADPGAARAFLQGDKAGTALPAHVIRMLDAWCAGAAWAGVKAESDFIRDYRKAWSGTPFPAQFITVDAVVQHGGRILLIERGHYPGKGLWALPGGFVHQDERLVDACIRELLEETGLPLPASDLKNSIRGTRAFDHPQRSTLGRIITHTFHFDLGDNGDPPAVRGGDDASQARWAALDELDPSVLHDDHYFIIRQMIR